MLEDREHDVRLRVVRLAAASFVFAGDIWQVVATGRG
ncbi:hypothetical protein Afer_1045 [Acidimicrobium ferrooxidans DSM 10331]|uniref:Uncharacterized protein n=1 Tax=Acidimicrobium ferrooxidans (strain DSM 10331 / JCM 15462 / NBRC 103882 / ICP) TaxID=525909 RepID=C7LZ25_ACIFD|nr:hypothetical protein Afer_1045 [Acidimicrobium ferrooxidans DSM 10331]